MLFMEINQGTLALITLCIFIIGIGLIAEKQERKRMPTSKNCNFCDEKIKMKATVCKHCGSTQL